MNQSAAQAYAAHQKDIAALIRLLQVELADDMIDAAKEPNDWGYVGTLGAVRQQLVDAFDVLTGFGKRGIERNIREAQTNEA